MSPILDPNEVQQLAGGYQRPAERLKPTEYEPTFARVWRDYIIGPDLETWDRLAEPAVDSGIYFLFCREGSLLYIGQSVGIAFRLSTHLKARRIPFMEYGTLAVPLDFIDQVEAAYIKALEPPMNRKFPSLGWGRKTVDLMIPAIREVWGEKC